MLSQTISRDFFAEQSPKEWRKKQEGKHFGFFRRIAGLSGHPISLPKKNLHAGLLAPDNRHQNCVTFPSNGWATAKQLSLSSQLFSLLKIFFFPVLFLYSSFPLDLALKFFFPHFIFFFPRTSIKPSLGPLRSQRGNSARTKSKRYQSRRGGGGRWKAISSARYFLELSGLRDVHRGRGMEGTILAWPL